MRSLINDPLPLALAYAQRGMKIFPVHSVIEEDGVLICSCIHGRKCKAQGKHPVSELAPHGFKDATSDLVVIEKWFGSPNEYNIGIATGEGSGVVALDVDIKGDGYKTLLAFEDEYGPLPQTLRWKTGGGGEHILFLHPKQLIRNSVRAIGAGLDVRGDGGYIVAPPSRHISGGEYSLKEGHSLEQPLAEVPPWLLNKISQNRKEEEARKESTFEIGGLAVLEGSRNDSIARVSGELIGAGLSVDRCFEFMVAWNKTYCEPPLQKEEVKGVIESIYRCEMSKASPLPKLICAADFDFEAPERTWVVEGWIPAGCVTGIFGPGGVGKSLLAQQLATVLSVNYSQPTGDV